MSVPNVVLVEENLKGEKLFSRCARGMGKSEINFMTAWCELEKLAGLTEEKFYRQLRFYRQLSAAQSNETT